MKRYQLVLLLVPITVLFTLWLTRLTWWPFVLNLRDPLDKNANVIQAVGTLIALIGSAYGLFVAYSRLFRTENKGL